MQKKATTVLGRAVSTSVGSQNTVPAHQQNGAKNSLRDVILGGQDGLVNMLGIALGVIAGGGSNHILLMTGIAASITESISMGAVAYTSFGSDRDFYLAEKRREQDHVSSRPEEEREEIKEIYAAKGFTINPQRKELIATIEARGAQVTRKVGDSFVGIWNYTDNGDIPPKALIKGANTQLIAPRGAAISPEHGEIFVIDKVQNGIFAFSWQKILDDLQSR